MVSRETREQDELIIRLLLFLIDIQPKSSVSIDNPDSAFLLPIALTFTGSTLCQFDVVHQEVEALVSLLILVLNLNV